MPEVPEVNFQEPLDESGRPPKVYSDRFIRRMNYLKAVERTCGGAVTIDRDTPICSAAGSKRFTYENPKTGKTETGLFCNQHYKDIAVRAGWKIIGEVEHLPALPPKTGPRRR